MGRAGKPVGGFLTVSSSAVVALFLFGLPKTQAAFSIPAVIINEIMWDGTEYVELYNTTDAAISLENWKLTKQKAGGTAETVVTLGSSDNIAAKGYFLLEKNEAATEITGSKLVSGLTLLNTGEQLQLLKSDGTTVDSANQLGSWFFGENTDKGKAMERNPTIEDGTVATSWHTATGSSGGRDGTPGGANSSPPANQAPQAVLTGPGNGLIKQNLSFLGEDSADPEGASLTYSWTFGDGGSSTEQNATHAYSAAGTYEVVLTVNDGSLNHQATLTVIIAAPSYSDALVIHEFLPDPAGSDATGEFIELKNTGSASVDLAGWQIDDAAGGSKPYTISSGVSMSAGSILSFGRLETKLALNNTSDSVRLLAPDGTVKASATYKKSSEGLSYNRSDSGDYVESSTPTPGKANTITTTTSDTEEDETDKKEDEKTDAASTKPGRVLGVTTQKPQPIVLKNIRSMKKDTLVETQGVVSAPPGVLGERIMYLAGSGIQVYLPESDEVPDFPVGSTVTVTGALSSYLGESRLKIASLTGVQVTQQEEAPPQPHTVKTGDVGEAVEGYLVEIAGQVSRTNGDIFYLNDGSGEVKVVIKPSTEIDKPAMKKGIWVTVTGVVSETRSGYRVLPRFPADIRFGKVAGLKKFPATGANSFAFPLTFQLFLASWTRSHAW